MAAQTSVKQLINQIPDPVSQRAMLALLTAVQADIAAIYTAHNAHQHAAFNAAPTTNLLGNLNTLP